MHEISDLKQKICNKHKINSFSFPKMEQFQERTGNIKMKKKRLEFLSQ